MLNYPGRKITTRKFTSYIDAQGTPSVSFEPRVIEEKSDIENILDIPEKIASEQEFQVCVAFDEFQEVNRIEPFLINWMRSAFQRHQNTSYVFLGSKQSSMESIFADPNSPFYEFGFKVRGTIIFGKLSKALWFTCFFHANRRDKLSFEKRFNQ